MIHEVAPVFLFPYLMQGSAKQELPHRIETDSDSEGSSNDTPSGTFISYDEVVNHLLATYADNSTIYLTDSAIIALKQREPGAYRL